MSISSKPFGGSMRQGSAPRQIQSGSRECMPLCDVSIGQEAMHSRAQAQGSPTNGSARAGEMSQTLTCTRCTRGGPQKRNFVGPKGTVQPVAFHLQTHRANTAHRLDKLGLQCCELDLHACHL